MRQKAAPRDTPLGVTLHRVKAAGHQRKIAVLGPIRNHYVMHRLCTDMFTKYALCVYVQAANPRHYYVHPA